MDIEQLPALPTGYRWMAIELADGRKAIEVRFQHRSVVAYAFQPKRRKCWYISDGDLDHLSAPTEIERPQCETMREACDQLAGRAREHKRSSDETRGGTR